MQTQTKSNDLTKLKELGPGEHLLEVKALGTGRYSPWGIFYVQESSNGARGSAVLNFQGPEVKLFSRAIGEPAEDLFVHTKGTAHPCKGMTLRVKLTESKAISSKTGRPYINVTSVDVVE